MEYKEQLRDKRWISFRDKIIKRDKVCQLCGAKKKLQVHHTVYINGYMAWNYNPDDLYVLCDGCHKKETNDRITLNILIRDMLKSGLLASEIMLKIKTI